jgi:hypothetical protein
VIRLALALFAVAALARAELPLGPFGRPGVPVLVRADGEVEVSGWSFAIDGVGLVHPPTLPATIEGEQLEPIPGGTRLVGVWGSVPPDFAGMFEDPVRVVPVELSGVPSQYWRALDAFDRIVIAPDAQLDESVAILLQWLGAGGDLVSVGQTRDWLNWERLGRSIVVGDWDEAAETDWLRPRVPHGGNVWREVYDVVRTPQGPEDAAIAARWIAAGTALALALQILIGALGWVSRRKTVAGLAVVALLGGGLGIARTRADYVPTAQGAFEIVYRAGIHARVRRFEITLATGPGATLERGDGLATPCLFRAPGEPWWNGPRGPIPVPEGQQRLLRFERAERIEPGRIELETPEVDRNYRRLLRRVAPEGWKVVGYSRISAPKPSRGAIPLLGRVEVVPVR